MKKRTQIKYVLQFTYDGADGEWHNSEDGSYTVKRDALSDVKRLNSEKRAYLRYRCVKETTITTTEPIK